MVELDVGRKINGLVSRNIFRRREVVILIAKALFVEARLINFDRLLFGFRLRLRLGSRLGSLYSGRLGFIVDGLLLNVLGSNIRGQEQ